MKVQQQFDGSQQRIGNLAMNVGQRGGKTMVVVKDNDSFYFFSFTKIFPYHGNLTFLQER